MRDIPTSLTHGIMALQAVPGAEGALGVEEALEAAGALALAADLGIKMEMA